MMIMIHDLILGARQTDVGWPDLGGSRCGWRVYTATSGCVSHSGDAWQIGRTRDDIPIASDFPVIASGAKQSPSRYARRWGLPHRFAPRTDSGPPSPV